MTILARIVAVICVIAFIFTAICVAFFHAAGTRVSRAKLYKDTLVQEQFYARFPTILTDGVLSAIELESRQAGNSEMKAGLDAAKQLTRADWETIFGAVLPADYVQREIERSIDQFSAFVHSESATLGAGISLVDLKKRLAGLEAETAYTKILIGKPPCTDQQMRDSEGLPIGCRPSPEQMPQVLENFRKVMALAADEIPNEIDPFKHVRELDGPERRNAAFAKVRLWIARIELWATWSPAVPAALLALVALFAARSIRGLLLWWGVPCFIAGLVTVVFAFPSVRLARWIFKVFVVPMFPPDVPAATFEVFFGVMTGVVQQVLSAALSSGGILVGCGLVAMILARFFRPKKMA